MTDPRPPMPRYNGIEQDDYGVYVLYADHAAEVARLEARVKELEQSRIICKRIMGALVDAGTVGVTTTDDGANLESGVRQLTSERDALTARVAELDQCLRLNLAVGPDDPMIVDPIETRLLAAEAKLAEAEQAIIRMCPPGTCKVQAPNECICLVTVNELRERERRLRAALQKVIDGEYDDLDPDDGLHTNSVREMARQALRESSDEPATR